jgi:RNA polymerase sigma-70 factor (ECF subfamily)
MTVAEELSLDAFAEVAAGPTFFSDKSSFKTWLFSIGKNLALMQLRKTIHTEDIENVSVAGDQSPELDILKSEKKQVA